jgi:hypothetical protein
MPGEALTLSHAALDPISRAATMRASFSTTPNSGRADGARQPVALSVWLPEQTISVAYPAAELERGVAAMVLPVAEYGA